MNLPIGKQFFSQITSFLRSYILIGLGFIIQKCQALLKKTCGSQAVLAQRLFNNYLITENEVVTAKSQTEALPC